MPVDWTRGRPRRRSHRAPRARGADRRGAGVVQAAARAPAHAEVRPSAASMAARSGSTRSIHSTGPEGHLCHRIRLPRALYTPGHESRTSSRCAHCSDRRSGGGKQWASTVATMVRCTRSDPRGRRRSARRRGALAVTAVALVCYITEPARAASSDRAINACLLARMDPPPRLVVYGSSRAAKLEPSYLGSLLGTTVSNASVSSATAEDTWALAHPVHEQTDPTPARALWFLDIESLRPRRFDASLLEIPTLARSFTASGGSILPAAEVAHGRASRQCASTTSASADYAPDGFRTRDFHDVAAALGIHARPGVAVGDHALPADLRPRVSADLTGAGRLGYPDDSRVQ